MTDAPERVWANTGVYPDYGQDWTKGEWLDEKCAYATVEYIRADTVAGMVTEARNPVKVKPLVWEYHPCGAMAAPPTGHAYIIDTRMKGRVYSVKGFNPQRDFSSMDEAKAAAQEDYERRILGALE